ncbi:MULTISPECIES: hypothetical protein [unclassified Roseivivax]|uniref:hypothetical protein n=1 Tax=unclassified Roseivivax TaxID=2639302 RepID=UPI001269574B|nr:MULTISPECIES: hypothetical protein [unclassified Roseivivax]
MQDRSCKDVPESEAPPEDKPYIEELRSKDRRRCFGFKVGGSLVGPTAMVACQAVLARQVYQRLLLIPSLNRLRGQLYLVAWEELDDAQNFAALKADLGITKPVDRSLALPMRDLNNIPDTEADAIIRQGYWQVLRLCADLGMIDGRGVPSS